MLGCRTELKTDVACELRGVSIHIPDPDQSVRDDFVEAGCIAATVCSISVAMTDVPRVFISARIISMTTAHIYRIGRFFDQYR